MQGKTRKQNHAGANVENKGKVDGEDGNAFELEADIRRDEGRDSCRGEPSEEGSRGGRRRRGVRVVACLARRYPYAGA